MDDDQLMIRLQSGDARAFDELVERYQAQLIGFFFRNTRDMQFSEDLTQETLLRIFSQSWDYLPVGKFRAWMYRMARNLLIDNVRRQSHDALIKAVKGSSGDDDRFARLVSEVMPPEMQAHQRELTQIVDQLLEQLPEDQRVTFILQHYVGLTLAEVSEVMDCPLATSKSRLRLAREKLQERLRERGFGTPTPDQDDLTHESKLE
jgi:RNA polymerase sigma-70 factor, ECF subfamily